MTTTTSAPQQGYCEYECPSYCCSPSCCQEDRSTVTDLWYFWFVLSILAVLIVLFVARCVKRRNEESRIIRVHHSFSAAPKSAAAHTGEAYHHQQEHGKQSSESGSILEAAGSKRSLNLRPPPQAITLTSLPVASRRARTAYPGMMSQAELELSKEEALTAGLRGLDPAYISVTSRGPLKQQSEIPGYLGSNTHQAAYRDFNHSVIPEHPAAAAGGGQRTNNGNILPALQR